MLELNEVQEGVLNIVFRVAADEKMPIVDLKDLRSLVSSIAQRLKELTTKYGNVGTTSVGAIQRRLLVLEEQGANQFFGEPALDIHDFLRTAPDGRGMVNILTADKLMEKPRLYATFLLWMLTKLWQTLPEVGDQPKPKLVFFDEAHLLFSDAPKPCWSASSRSRGSCLEGRRRLLHHAEPARRARYRLGAARQPRAARAARLHAAGAEGDQGGGRDLPQEPDLDTERVILELKVGEALVSMLENKGEPSIVQRTLIRPPAGRLGPVTPEERRRLVEASPLHGRYEDAVDRESAHEMLAKRTEAAAKEASAGGSWTDVIFGGSTTTGGRRQTQGMGTMIVKELQRSASRTIATTIKNIILGAIRGKRR